MTDQPELTPPDSKDVESALSFGLRYSGRKRINRLSGAVHQAGDA